MRAALTEAIFVLIAISLQSPNCFACMPSGWLLKRKGYLVSSEGTQKSTWLASLKAEQGKM